MLTKADKETHGLTGKMEGCPNTGDTDQGGAITKGRGKKEQRQEV